MLLLWIGAAYGADLVVAHARLWDGTGAPVAADVDIAVHDGRIAAIGPNLVAPEGARVIDASGATVIPGLVDAHVHVGIEPGGSFRTESPERHVELMAAHLRAYVACGVTTILDDGILPGDLEAVLATIASGAASPRFRTLGTILTAKDGYAATVIPEFPTVGTPAEVDAALDRLVAQGAVGVKTTAERGLVRAIWPLYTPEVAAEIVAGAAARHLPIYTHAMAPDMQAYAVDTLHATVLVHPLDRPDRKVVAKLAAAHVTEISTFSVIDGMRASWQPERLTDPLVRLVAPPDELATATDPTVRRDFPTRMVEAVAPRMIFPATIAHLGARESTVKHRLDREMRAVRELVDAGVPVALGSDSGGWPLIPYLFHGTTTLREIELLGIAGFSNADVLAMSTRGAATVARVDPDVGTVEVGKVADLVVVDGDPLVDLKALRHARYVVHDGVAKTPAEWATP